MDTARSRIVIVDGDAARRLAAALPSIRGDRPACRAVHQPPALAPAAMERLP